MWHPVLPVHPPSEANSQEGPGLGPDTQLRWQLMEAQVWRRRLDSIGEPGAGVVVLLRPNSIPINY